ncbi:MAG: peptidylprolyl isomerase [Terriglobales bacterium]
MRGFVLVGILMAPMAWAQTNSAAAPVKDSQKPAVVAENDAVLTVKGLCSPPNAATGPADPKCETVVTRAEFEELLLMLRSDKDPQTKHELTTAYPQLLVMAHEAEVRGVDKEARFEERIRFARLQILSQELLRELKEQAAQVPEKEIEDYYQQNAGQYEQVVLDRVVVPIRAQGAKQGTMDEAGLKKLAESLRARAAAGEDFSKLQKEAYKAAGLSGDTEPNPRMEKLRRRGLPPAHASAFDLKPGEVSPVMSDVSGHYIYKLESRETQPLEAVRAEISKTLRQQRLEKLVHDVQEPFTTDVNQAYFGGGGKAGKN